MLRGGSEEASLGGADLGDFLLGMGRRELPCVWSQAMGLDSEKPPRA